MAARVDASCCCPCTRLAFSRKGTQLLPTKPPPGRFAGSTQPQRLQAAPGNVRATPGLYQAALGLVAPAARRHRPARRHRSAAAAPAALPQATMVLTRRAAAKKFVDLPEDIQLRSSGTWTSRSGEELLLLPPAVAVTLESACSLTASPLFATTPGLSGARLRWHAAPGIAWPLRPS